MDASVGKRPPQAGHEDPHLVHAPPQAPGQQGEAHGLAPPREVLAGQPPDLLVPLVLGPGVSGPLEGAAGDLGVAGVPHHGGEVVHDAEGESHLRGGLVHVLVPFDDGEVGRHGAVVAVDIEVDVVAFEPAAGL